MLGRHSEFRLRGKWPGLSWDKHGKQQQASARVVSFNMRLFLREQFLCVNGVFEVLNKDEEVHGARRHRPEQEFEI